VRRLSDRLIGSAAAIALQAGFLLLLLQSVHILHPPAKLARELTLILPRLRSQPPQQQAAPRALSPPIVQTPSAVPLPPPPEDAAPSTADVQGLGRALFGCAPEAYANLSLEDRAHCPKPGVNTPPTAEEELYPKSHSKDAATWQEDLDERHHDSTVCFGAALVAQCMVEAEQAEHQRAASVRQQIESDKRKAQMPAGPPVPRSR
jgi:cell division septation protein DedD